MFCYVSSPTNQRRSIGIGIMLVFRTLITTNYIATDTKNNYFVLLKLQIDDFSHHLHFKWIRVCCLVSTSPGHLLTHARAVYATTWGSGWDRLFFITEYSQTNMTFEPKRFPQRIPTAPIHNIKSGYTHLTQKSILAFLFVYENYFNDFIGFLKQMMIHIWLWKI
jgi:hypothetical protein